MSAETGVSYSDLYKKCELCPRMCRVDRTAGKTGYCGASDVPETALTMLHRWEEPCISGTDPDRGSGAVFFAHCTLGCVYCQNYRISGRNAQNGDGSYKGKRTDAACLAEVMVRLQNDGAYNINLVTPTHYMPTIAEAVIIARKNGLTVPTVYNTGGFERAKIISQLGGIVDVFLTDMKYLTDVTARKYSGTGAYVENAWEALSEMVRITGNKPVFGNDGLLRRGVIVRHLVLPGRSYSAKKNTEKLYGRFGDNIIYSLMNQYTPVAANPRLSGFPELMRPVAEREYAACVETLERLSPEYAYIQEGGTIDESFIPEWQDPQDGGQA